MGGTDLRQVLWGQDEQLLAQTVHTQLGLFAVQAGQVDLLRSWGLGIDLLIGHSVGEVAAAYAAGVVTLAHAVGLVAARGWLMQQLPAGGAMLATGLSEAGWGSCWPGRWLSRPRRGWASRC